MKCLSCHAETTNGLALCERCRISASVYLEFLPVYFRNLARWRPERAGSRPVPSSREPRTVGYAADDHVSRALAAASNDLVGWARFLTEDRGIRPPVGETESEQVALLCRWLNENLTSVATLDWCGDFLRADHREDVESQGIGFHEWTLRDLTERVAPGWYAGGCRHCGVGTYVVPGLTWVTCGGCGTTTYARDHLDTILDEARPWVAIPARLAEAIVCLVDTEQSVQRLRKRIAKWGERGRITGSRRLDADGDEVGPKRYRLGEVLDALLSEGTTRLEDDVQAS